MNSITHDKKLSKRRGRIDVTCVGCGGTFSTPISNYERGNAKFCSRTCLQSYSRKPEVIKERLLAQIDCNPHPHECQLWTGSTTPAGYGKASIPGDELNTKKWIVVHRWLYEQEYGPLPANLDACHSCDTPRCCNLEHIFPGDRTVNMRDAKAKGRTATGQRNGSHTKPEHRPYGESHGRNRITESQALEIIARYEPFKTSYQMLANEYNIAWESVRDIVKGRNWAHLPRPATKQVELSGKSHPQALLTDDEVREVRRILSLPRKERETQQQLADRFNVSRSLISAIANGNTRTPVQ